MCGRRGGEEEEAAAAGSEETSETGAEEDVTPLTERKSINSGFLWRARLRRVGLQPSQQSEGRRQ